ncbi:MAG: Rrf2 family transcriptional regulator [Pseudomonadota bacterium]|nr:Rrf2 family transcriptional regulator [Pseudomonadota bacterium]
MSRGNLFKIQKRIIYAIEAVLDIALNAGVNPVQNLAVAKRQGIPKRYLEQTLQILVKNNILVASRGPRGGYRLAKERRKIKILDIIKSVTTEKEVNELYKSNISKIIIQPLINKFLEESMVYLNKISVEDIYNQYKQKNKDNSNKKVDFVI